MTRPRTNPAPPFRRGDLTLHLDHSARPGGTLRTVKVEGGLAGYFLGGRTLHFGFPGQRLPPPEDLDAALFGCLMFAMRIGASLRVDGPVTATALRNAQEFQEAWAAMAPDRYQAVPIEAERVLDETRRRREALAAFSGGLDSTFTLLRQHAQTPGRYGVRSVVMVHGFDVGVRNTQGFDELRRRVQPLLDALEVETLVVRTNAKQPGPFQPSKWEHSFGAQLAGVLHHYSHRFGEGLIASSEPYDALVMPWGSSPALDHLLTGGRMRVVHDGAGFSRSAKAAEIAGHAAAMKGLKVCWAGADQGRNCGVCEKCVRTRLNFLAVGAGEPACFDQPFDPAAIDTIEPENAAALAELVSVAAEAARRGAEGAWLERLRRRLRQLGAAA